MMAGLTRLTSGAALDDLVAVLERDGAVIVEDLVGADVLAGLWADLGPCLESGARQQKPSNPEWLVSAPPQPRLHRHSS
ncbi:hypothetical protein ACWEPC_45930, partial [Nonomuraea sp. NPDC004297]